MKTNSSARSKQYLEAKGYVWAKTETWNQFTKQRKDLFNIFDGLAVDPEGNWIGVQACGSDVKEHVRKIQENPLFQRVSKKMPVYILSWRKLKKVRGKKATYWDCKVFNLFGDSCIESEL